MTARHPLAAQKAQVWPGAWGFDGLPRHTIDALERFLARVDALSYDQWVDLGRRATHGSGAGRERSIMPTAEARLQAAIDERRLGLISWLVRDAIDCAVQQEMLSQRLHDPHTTAMLRAARQWLYYTAMALVIPEQADGLDYDALSAVFGSSMLT